MVTRRRDGKPAVVPTASLSWRHDASSLGVNGGGHLPGKIVKWARRLFPERQILVRAEGRVSYVTLSRRAQIAMATTGVAAIAVLAYGLAGPLYRVQATAEQLAPQVAELQTQVAELQRQLAAANAQRAQPPSTAAADESKAAVDEARERIKALEQARDRAIAEQKEMQRQLGQAQEAANTRAQSLAQLNRTLDANRGERQSMQARLHQLETELESANARTSQYKSDLAGNERKLQQLAAEHDRTAAERDRLQARLTELQGRSSALPPLAPSAAEQAPAPLPQPGAPSRAIADRPPDQRSDNIVNSSEVERLLASTGIDVERLLGRFGSLPQGQGGPYVALDGGRLAGADARSEELQKIIKTLPLGAPLAHYQIESGFGGRADPFHGRQAFHAGVDMSAPYRSPVYSTAPGRVTFTGVKDNYGKVVEIDHGNGILTRYAHLHRIVVARGQTVEMHHQVGEMGSTGRSTGPHLHYEVVVDGTAQDPEKFLQAGKNVVQARGN